MAAKQISNLFSTPNSKEKKNFAMKMLFAKHLLKVLPEIVEEKCFGCQVDHLSQIQHDVCLMMTKAEKVEVCLDTALDRLNYIEIYEEFLALFPDIRPEAHTFEPYDNEEWRNDLKESLIYLL